jgi:hypothetical protein
MSIRLAKITHAVAERQLIEVARPSPQELIELRVGRPAPIPLTPDT